MLETVLGVLAIWTAFSALAALVLGKIMYDTTDQPEAPAPLSRTRQREQAA